jgi:hypothetical protein
MLSAIKYIRGKYSERYQRRPPPGYEKWLRRAIKDRVFVDPAVYDQIDLNLLPFRDPTHPNKPTLSLTRLEQLQQNITQLSHLLATKQLLFVRAHRGKFDGLQNSHLAKLYHVMESYYQELMPQNEFAFFLSILDEPISIPLEEDRRPSSPNVHNDATVLHKDDDSDDDHGDDPTNAGNIWHGLLQRSECLQNMFIRRQNVSSGYQGHESRPLAYWHNYFRDWDEGKSTVPISFPVFSSCKLACYHDIIVPHYDHLYWQPVTPIPWTEKKNRVVFRGAPSGFLVHDDHQWLNAVRLRLVEWAASLNLTMFPIELDVELHVDGNDGCDSESSCKEMREYVHSSTQRNQHKHTLDLTDLAQSRYIIAIDGNSWTGRRIEMQIKTGSIILWSSIFHDWKSHWMVPFEHYIPFPPERSFESLTEILWWAHHHPKAVARIAEEGRKLGEEHMRLVDFEMYSLLVISEYASLFESAPAAS